MAHRAHSRAIAPIVVIVYGAVLITAAWAVWSRPNSWTWTAATASAAAMAVTAIAAAPAHGRLSAGYQAHLVTRLVTVDRLRTAAAALAALAAFAAQP